MHTWFIFQWLSLICVLVLLCNCFNMYLKAAVTHGKIMSSCPHKALIKRGNLSSLTGQWCLSSRQPQEVRRRSYFAANVAHFVGRLCGGDTTQGVTPPHPPPSLDLLSGTPWMEQGVVSVVVLPGMSMLPGGALSCPTSPPMIWVFCCAWHQTAHHLWLDWFLHSACGFFGPTFLKTSLFLLLSSHPIF